MNKNHLFILMFAVLFSFTSCDNERDKIPRLVSFEIASSAHFGDSIPFSITVDGNEPFNRVQATLFYGENVVSETFIPINDPGRYSGKLFIPLLQNVEDRRARVRFKAMNREFDFVTSDTEINLTRPTFQYLTLRTEEGDFQMLPSDEDKNLFIVNAYFPETFGGLIIAPAYGERGNDITFGFIPATRTIRENQMTPIPFINFTSGYYDISFNILTFEGEPLTLPPLRLAFEIVGDAASIRNVDIGQEQEIIISGIDDLDSWWIDPTFFDPNDEGNLIFRAMNGRYRITANPVLRYFRVEPLDNNDNLATFDASTGEGAMWIIGSTSIGNPSFSANSINWGPVRGIAAAPMGNGIHQVRLTAGVTFNPSNVNFKFFGQRNWGFEFNIPEMSLATNPFFIQQTSDSNIVGAPGAVFETGRLYVITIDASRMPVSAVVTVE